MGNSKTELDWEDGVTKNKISDMFKTVGVITHCRKF